MEARSVPFSQTLPSLGSRSAIMRRNRLLPDPDGPVMAAHAPAPRLRSNGPANSLRSSFTTSAVCIEFPVCGGLPAVAKIRAPPIMAFAVIEYLITFRRRGTRTAACGERNGGLLLQKGAYRGHTAQGALNCSGPHP